MWRSTDPLAGTGSQTATSSMPPITPSPSRTQARIPRWLVLGPDRSGNLLEVVVLVTDTVEIAIHAMPMRPKYRGLLER